jgi:hypothetical protein
MALPHVFDDVIERTSNALLRRELMAASEDRFGSKTVLPTVANEVGSCLNNGHEVGQMLYDVATKLRCP